MTENTSIIHVEHASGSDTEAREAEPTRTAEVMTAVRNELRNSRETIVTEVTQKALPTIEAAVKRALEGTATRTKEKASKRPYKQHMFKNKGNQRRFEKNEEIMASIEEAVEAIGENQLEAATKALEKGTKILIKQQKLIKMADREENGWEVVRFYMSDDLASDSDDEKAINRARREALASRKKRIAEKQPRKGDTFRNASQGRNTRGYGYGGDYSKAYGDGGSRTGNREGPVCYCCGKEGHMQYACPTKCDRK